MKINVNWVTHLEDASLFDGISMLMLDPVPVLKYYDENKTAKFRRCPAYINSLKNTFVLLCPIDLKIEINVKEQWANVIYPDSLPRSCLFLRFTDVHESPYFIFSLKVAPYMFYSEQSVLLEMLEPYFEWGKKNPTRVINGMYDIGKWIRPLEFAYESNKEHFFVEFKRGDPMCYVRFITKNENDIVNLNRAVETEAIKKQSSENTKIKSFYKNTSLQFLYDIRNKYNQFLKGVK